MIVQCVDAPQKILLTGSTGFIGKPLLAQLKARSFDVVAVSQFGGDGSIAFPFEHNSDWGPLLSGVDCVIHAAARAHVMHEDSPDSLPLYRKVNVTPTLQLAEQAARSGVRRFIFLSTVKVNGEDSLIDTPPMSESGSPSPKDPYAISKYEAEVGLADIAKRTGMEIVIIRPPLVYGPDVKANFRALLKLVETGLPLPFGAIANKRSLIGLRNLISFVIECIHHPAAINQTFLVSDGHDVSTAELVQKMYRVQGKPSRMFPIPVFILRIAGALTGRRAAINRLCGSLQVDITKARSLLGWEPPFSLEQQLAETVAGHLGRQPSIVSGLNSNGVGL